MPKRVVTTITETLKRGLYERSELPEWVTPSALPNERFAIFFLGKALPLIEYIFELKDGTVAFTDAIGHFAAVKKGHPWRARGPKPIKSALYYLPIAVGQAAFKEAERRWAVYEMVVQTQEADPPVREACV